MNSFLKSYLTIGFFFLHLGIVSGQNQRFTDSLIERYQSGTYKGNELDLLKSIAEEETDPSKAALWADTLIMKASEDSLFLYIHSGLLQKGNALRALGDSASALESYFESLKYAERADDQKGIGVLMIAIAGAYSEIEITRNAKLFYKRGISILRQLEDSTSIANALLNAGDLYFKTGDIDSSRIYTQEAEDIYTRLDFPLGLAYSSGNLGMVYAEQGKDSLALQNINQAIAILEDLEDYYPICVYLTYLSDIYAKKDWDQAISYAERSLKLARRYRLKDQISGANLKLAELHEQRGNYQKSNSYLKEYYLYRDSVLNIETVEQMADLRTNYEVSQKQAQLDLKEAEINLLNQKQRTQRITIFATILGLGLILLFAIGLYRRNRYIQETSKIIQKERDRSDELLLNILPEQTAQELKEHGVVKAQKFDSVTVMFTDFKGFTKLADQLAPEKLVEAIGIYFSRFDEIIEKYDLEKIKTIGDAYMCAGGLPFPVEDHARKTVMAAIEIAAFVESIKQDFHFGPMAFDIRIGINTGPVVAGVVGSKKFAYDIWGDTVNIASRMETNSEPGRINLSESTYKEVHEEFPCEYRGEIEVKNRGFLKMYFLSQS